MSTKLLQVRAIVREVGRTVPDDPVAHGARLEVRDGAGVAQPLELRYLTKDEAQALAACLDSAVTITITTEKKIPGFNEP